METIEIRSSNFTLETNIIYYLRVLVLWKRSEMILLIVEVKVIIKIMLITVVTLFRFFLFMNIVYTRSLKVLAFLIFLT